MDAQAVVDKLRQVEARFAATLPPRPETPEPRARLLAQLAEVRAREADTELTLSAAETMALRLLVALCQRYGFVAYRKPRQRRTTVCVKMPQAFFAQTFWPLFDALAAELERAVLPLAHRIIYEALGADVPDVEAVPLRLDDDDAPTGR